MKAAFVGLDVRDEVIPRLRSLLGAEVSVHPSEGGVTSALRLLISFDEAGEPVGAGSVLVLGDDASAEALKTARRLERRAGYELKVGHASFEPSADDAAVRSWFATGSWPAPAPVATAEEDDDDFSFLLAEDDEEDEEQVVAPAPAPVAPVAVVELDEPPLPGSASRATPAPSAEPQPVAPARQAQSPVFVVDDDVDFFSSLDDDPPLPGGRSSAPAPAPRAVEEQEERVLVEEEPALPSPRPRVNTIEALTAAAEREGRPVVPKPAVAPVVTPELDEAPLPRATASYRVARPAWGGAAPANETAQAPDLAPRPAPATRVVEAEPATPAPVADEPEQISAKAHFSQSRRARRAAQVQPEVEVEVEPEPEPPVQVQAAPEPEPAFQRPPAPSRPVSPRPVPVSIDEEDTEFEAAPAARESRPSPRPQPSVAPSSPNEEIMALASASASPLQRAQSLATELHAYGGAPTSRRSGLPRATIFWVSGSHGGCGKTTLSWLLANATALAMKRAGHLEDKPVYLIEADYSNPKLQQRLDLDRDNHSGYYADYIGKLNNARVPITGIADHAAQSAQVIAQTVHTTADTGLQVVACPYDVTSRSVQHLKVAVNQIVEYAERQGGYVFIDADTLDNDDVLDRTLAEKATHVVLVADYGHMDDMRRAAYTLTAPKIKSGMGLEQQKINLFFNNTKASTFEAAKEASHPYAARGFMPPVDAIASHSGSEGSSSWVGNLDSETLQKMAVQAMRFLQEVSPMEEITPFTSTRQYASGYKAPAGIFTRLRGLRPR